MSDYTILRGRRRVTYTILRRYRCGCQIRKRVYSGGYYGRVEIVWCQGCFGHRPHQS